MFFDTCVMNSRARIASFVADLCPDVALSALASTRSTEPSPSTSSMSILEKIDPHA